MTLTPVGHFTDAPPGFDHHAAELVYGIISKLDEDSAVVYADLLIGEIHQQALDNHADLIAKNLGSLLDRHGDALRTGLTRQYIAKRAAGEPVDDVVAAGVLIVKDFQGDQFTASARAERVRNQQRDLASGRFVKSHHDIVYDTHDDNGRRLSAATDHQLTRQGIATPEESRTAHAVAHGVEASKNKITLTGPQRLAYQQAYAQVQALVHGHQAHPEGKYLHFHYAGNRNPEAPIPLPPRGQALPIMPGQKLHSASLSDIPAHESLDTYDTYAAVRDAVATNHPLETDETGNNAGVQRIRSVNSALHGGDPFAATGARTMGRIGASAQYLDDTFRNSSGDSVLSPKVQAAIKAGKVVGVYGPEAANVIGPHADKTAYRYRGIERQPDRKFLTAMESLRRSPGLATPEDRREIAIHGLETDGGWRPSGVLNYFRSRLPNADLNTLQRKSGTIPPSEGVILDSKGRVVTQAVGYGDDHYLPFNLGKLRGLRGGEYLRTRTWGGPTTEDIYTGLVAGAKSLTVVSHNGVYTVEFDQGFTGKRRYNDKAARMVARYGYLLDAVKNGEITTGQVAPSRLAEIDRRASALADRDEDPVGFQREKDRLLAKERREPTFSEEQRAQASQEFLDNEALKHKTADGHEMTRTEFVDDWLDKQVGMERSEHRVGDDNFKARSSFDPRAAKADLARTYGLTDPDTVRFSQNAVRAMGIGDRYDQYVKRAEGQYRESLKPLELNGPGYDLALQALQEQFPYYIKSVDYHAWSDARQGKDTGYVNPKANRPAEVLSGYFEESLGGKVRANTTRGQAREAKPYKTTTQRIAERAKEAAATPAAALAGARRGASLTPDIERELRIDADNKMLEELRKHTTFGGGLTDDGVPDVAGLEKLKGRPVGELPSAELRKVSPDLVDLLDRSGDTSDPDKLHEKLTRAVAAVEKHGVFDLNKESVDRFKRGGKDAVAAKFDREKPGDNLRNADEEHDFGRVYSKGSGVPREDIQAELERVTGMPGQPHPTQLAEDQGKLSTRFNAYLQWQTKDGNPLNRPKNSESLKKEIEDHLRARQLTRRLNDLDEAERLREASEQAEEAGFGLRGTPGGRFDIYIDGLPAGSTATAESATGGTFTPLGDADQSWASQHGIQL